MAPRRGCRRVAAGVALGGAIVATAAGWLALSSLGAPPRSAAARLDAIGAHEHPSVVGFTAPLARALRVADRGSTPSEVALAPPWPLLAVGAQGAPASSGRAVALREVRVASVDAARRAFDDAEPGERIVFDPGTYRVTGRGFAARRGATAAEPIVVRAERPGSVVIEFDVVEGFVVAAPHWTFENLEMHGVCADDGACEHAFHVVASGTDFVARNNTVVDFNAHFKVNGQDGHYPDGGRIEANTLTATRPRRTGNPVTDIDLVGASGWIVRGNRISDFVKAGGDATSYGAFFKGGGSGNRFERNVVVCEDRLRGQPGVRVGLSLGGGGTGAASCRDGRCITEQDGGVIDSNLVAACSDDGVYVNRAAMSVVVHNTLVDTGGIVVRFPDSSAVVEGNLVDGMVRSRDGGLLHAADNVQTDVARLYLGRHPVRDLFVDAPALDFDWRDAAPRREGAGATRPGPLDLCGAARGTAPAYGAFEDYRRCRQVERGASR